MAERIEIQVLGSFALSGPASTADLTGRKLKALLAYLALNSDAQQPRDRLMALLWGSHFDVQARQNLRQALCRLRRTLADALVVTDDDRVGVDLDLLEVDAVRFETLCKDGSLVALVEADQLYCGDLLDAMTIKEVEWDNWLSAERARLRDLAVDARTKLAQMLISEARFEEALGAARRAVDLDPYREDAHCQLMLALAGLRRKADALRTFDELSALLAKELSTEPDAQTVLLRDAIRDGQLTVDKDVDKDRALMITDEGIDRPVQDENRMDLPDADPAYVEQVEQPATSTPPGVAKARGHDARWWKRYRIPVAMAAGGAVLAVTAMLTGWSAAGDTDGPKPPSHGPNLSLVTADGHQDVLVGTRIDMRSPGFEPASIWIKPNGKLELEWLRNSSLRQRVDKDVGIWRSKGDRFCMRFKWFRGGSEGCMWLFRHGASLTAVDQSERSLHLVFRSRAASRAQRLVPDASVAGKLLDGKHLAKLLPGTQLNFGHRGIPITMKLHAGGDLEIELLVLGPSGKQYDHDYGQWRIEDEKVCVKPGWWDNGQERCFSVHAGSYAYAFMYEGRVTPILLRKATN